jgi:hypothetical protein
MSTSSESNFLACSPAKPQIVGSASYAPANEDGRAYTLDIMVRGVRRLQYLEIVRCTQEGDTRQMVQVHVWAERTRYPAEKIKADLRTMWRLDVAHSSSALYRIEDKMSGGFEFRFALMQDNGEFVTGLFVVDVSEKKKALRAA